MAMDLNKSIRIAVDSGKVELGSEKARKLALHGNVKALVLSNNCPKEISQDLRHYSELSKVRIIPYEGTSLELGTACGKPFPVSVLSVIEEGDSDILAAKE